MTGMRFSFNSVSGGYGAMTIVRDLSGDLEPGACLCILGRNGVGKSTFVKILSGHLPCTTGEIILGDKSVAAHPPERRQQMGLSYAPQERPVFDTLTVRDNLVLMQPTDSMVAFEPFFETFPVLPQRLTQFAGTLSGGERKILSFVRAMAEGGGVTLLDEPSEGVQPENIEHMKRFILKAKASGRSFVVVEQHLHLAEAIADGFLVMDQGTAVLQAPASEIGRAEILGHMEV